MAGDLTNVETTVRYISRQKNKIKTLGDKFHIVKTVDDILTAKRENKLALGFWFQGSTLAALVDTLRFVHPASLRVATNRASAIEVDYC